MQFTKKIKKVLIILGSIGTVSLGIGLTMVLVPGCKEITYIFGGEPSLSCKPVEKWDFFVERYNNYKSTSAYKAFWPIISQQSMPQTDEEINDFINGNSLQNDFINFKTKYYQPIKQAGDLIIAGIVISCIPLIILIGILSWFAFMACRPYAMDKYNEFKKIQNIKKSTPKKPKDPSAKYRKYEELAEAASTPSTTPPVSKPQSYTKVAQIYNELQEESSESISTHSDIPTWDYPKWRDDSNNGQKK